MQINLQHSKAATDNLMKLIQQEHTDIVFVQEPYLYQPTGFMHQTKKSTAQQL
jgi:hypothetical protein